MKHYVVTRIYSDELKAWDIYWKWRWFTRRMWESEYWGEVRAAVKTVLDIISKFDVKSILDCSCGLGYKTILFAEAGYYVEGSDASREAVKYAPKLAREHGFNIRFFLSRFDELDEKCGRSYDCIWSDYFDEINTYEYLMLSAKAIYSVLKEGGIFMFTAPNKEELAEIIEKEWKSRRKITIHPPYKKGSIRVIHVEVAEKTSEGILENNIFLIEENDSLRAEIAQIMNPRIKWTYKNFKEILAKIGFKDIHIYKGLIIAVK